MAIKKFKPTTPGRRYMTIPSFEEITKKEPERSLVKILKNKRITTGQNNNKTSRWRHKANIEL